jgi:hypothetical protein
MKTTVLAVVFVITLMAVPADAHHSFAAQYDANKKIEFTGSVTKVEWMSPHIFIYVDVKDANGKVTNYAIEGGAPTRLYRQGWAPDTLKVGNTVTVQGALARDGSPLVNATTVILNGRKLFAGTSNPNDPSYSPTTR